ncbi:MAG: hypothetical protein RMA76_43235 [Deltaproteobacteria bacterium]|jgi:hypothetical protein
MSEQNKQGGPSKLAADLILSAEGDLRTEVESASSPEGEAPLDPSAFSSRPSSEPGLPTERIDLDPFSPVPRAIVDPAEAPRAPSIPPPADTMPSLDRSPVGEPASPTPNTWTPSPEPSFPRLPTPAEPPARTSPPSGEASAPSYPRMPAPSGAEAAPSYPRMPAPSGAEPAPSYPEIPAPGGQAVPPVGLAMPTPGAGAEAPVSPTLPTPGEGAQRARRVPLPTGLGPTEPSSTEYTSLQAHGIHALPIDEASATATREIRLPCSLLVAAPDLRVAAQTAAKLMERGYTCRVVDVEGMLAAIDQQPFDAAVLEIADGQAHRDGGQEALAPLERFAGPIVTLCGIPLAIETLDTRAQVRASIEKPFEMEQLVLAIEEAREDAEIARDAVVAKGRFDLNVNMVRAQVTLGEGQVTRGRIRAMSYDGEVVLDSREPLALGTKVSARFTTTQGREVEVPGRVVGVEGSTSSLQLKLQELDVDPIRLFVDEARDITTPAIAQVLIRALVAPPRGDSLEGNRSLQEHWTQVRGRLDDDEAHQVFIKSCLEAKQIEFAVRCYRELKNANPEDERIQKYLNQVGTILGFYAFKKADAEKDEGGMPTMWKVALGLFVLMVLILWVVGTLIS